MWAGTWKGLGVWLCQCLLDHCGTEVLQTELGMCWIAELRAGSMVCPPLGLDRPCPPEHSLLSQLLLIMFMNSTVRGQLGLPVLGPQSSGRRPRAQLSPCESPWPRTVVFSTPRSSGGQFSSPLVCVQQQLGLRGGQDLCPLSSQTRRQDHWLTLRSHLGPTRIPISVLPLGLWTGTGNYAKYL